MIAVNLDLLAPEVRATHEKVAHERAKLEERFKKEFDHEPKADNGKLDRVLDSMVGKPAKKRGRPLGSRNKPKPPDTRPGYIGHIPEPADLIFGR